MQGPNIQSNSTVQQTGGSFWLHITLLLSLCGVLYFPYLGNTPLFDKGEPREALAVQDIVQRGEWLFPLKRAMAIPSKPPLFHWSAALTYQVTGTLNEATIRFPSALYATLGVLLIYLLGRKLFGAEVGLLAAAILATTMTYQDQALSARVDMTLCFFVTASLALFYALYRGFLGNAFWYYALYGLVGLGTLAKGPLGILLPALVIAIFLALKKRWDLMIKFAFHPGVVLALIVIMGWYGLAITRGGEGFVDRQLLSENVNRFFGGSGHSHPVYYYLGYLFTLALPWGLFLPFLFWDGFKKGWRDGDDRLFLLVWFTVMFGFFSFAAGKRPVYLLPIYPALALLLADWFHRQVGSIGIRSLFFRALAGFAALMGVMLLLIVFGDLWGHNPGWFFSPIESALKPKDRANFLVITRQLADFGWQFDLAAMLSALLWFGMGYCLWMGRLRAAAQQLVILAIVIGFVTHGLIIPEIAATKSYREFMSEVNRSVGPQERLVIYGGFNSDPVIFYRGQMIEIDDRPIAAVAASLTSGAGAVIMTERTWQEVHKQNGQLPAPLVRSVGKGPEGDAPLVLVSGKIS
jgi:4-amino-4-deoxy-L-arabinose transferase-like glycosyltransferase